MKVLFIGRADNPAEDKSSLTNVAATAFRFMLEADPELQVYWTIPRRTKDEPLETYAGQKFGDNADRVHYVKVNSSLTDRTEGYFFTEDLWYSLSQTKTPFAYDVVLSNKPALASIFQTILTNKYYAMRHNVTVPFVNWQLWTATDLQLAAVPEYYAGPPDVLAETLSTFHGYSIYESDYLFKQTYDTLAKWVNPSALWQLMNERGVSIPNGINLERIDQHVQRGEPHEGRTIFWGGRFANQKRPKDTLEAMNAVFRAGKVNRAIVTTPMPESDPDVALYRGLFPALDIRTGVGQDTWFSLLSQGDVSLCLSRSEGYGSGWLEMLYAGIPIVYLKEAWQHGVLPDDYPFVVTNLSEVVPMLIAVLNDLDRAKRYMTERVVPWVREKHDQRVNSARIVETLRQKHLLALDTDRKEISSRGMIDLAVSAAKTLGNRFTEEAWYAALAERASGNREWGARGDVVTRMFLRRLLQMNGYKDVGLGDKIVFQKETDT